MSIFGRVKAKAEELLGRAEQVYGDPAAEAAGEARLAEAEAEAEALESDEHRRRPDDDGLAGQGAVR